MMANIQQIGTNLIGSFAVEPSSGEAYSSIIFGYMEGDHIRANHLTVKDASNLQISVTFTDAHIVGHETLKGIFCIQDEDMNALSSPYEVIRK
jgi:hypothetical protein